MGDADETVRPEFVWAALDCPGNWAPIVMGRFPDSPWTLGRMAVRSTAPVGCGERIVVLAWPIGWEGRKLFSGSALLSDAGELLAYSKQTCIVVKPA